MNIMSIEKEIVQDIIKEYPELKEGQAEKFKDNLFNFWNKIIIDLENENLL